MMTFRNLFLVLVGFCVPATSLFGNDVLKPASERFATDTQEVPSFQRHVLPLMGRAGCNGRACHGSFQGQGGFRLSLFGYDFKADHEALAKGEQPRINLQDVPESLMLLKATLETPHKGGKRIEPDGWEYRVFSRWIQSGAKGVEEDDVGFERLEVTPANIVFTKAGETAQLKVIAVWRDGAQEDVTPLCRFRTNDESISEIDANGKVTALAAGDTHVVAFYDNGVAPVQTLLPISNQSGPDYPSVPTPTRIDELVVQKLKTLGMVPSEVSTDAEFLRRVSLDMTGTLPAASEIEAFLADASPGKRARKIDELLERPAYAAWWATRLSDTLGNNPQTFLENGRRIGQRSASLWYSWLERRLRENMPYDKLVEAMLVSNSRQPGQSYEDYLSQMAAMYRKAYATDCDHLETVPFFWERKTFNQPAERSLAVAYAFLGVRLQCAQCHKHPFDQWTQDDFKQFTNFFDRVVYRDPAEKEGKERFKQLNQMVKKETKDNGRQIIDDGQPYPFREVYVVANQAPPKRDNPKNNKKPKVTRSVTARALGEDPVDLPGTVDPRQLLMNWLREKNNPYFAKSIVNRVWAAYFGAGIIEPADDLNLANPPSNAPLLAYLEQQFIEHGYDLKWLHREIANSRTYQLSWHTNETNRYDSRNFSHAIPRRLPAEVAVDAIQLALASNDQLADWAKDPTRRAICKTDGFARNQNPGDYALGIFGRPARVSNCDCERSTDASLLQTIYLRNDGEMLRKLTDSAWLKGLDKQLGFAVAQSDSKPDRKPKRNPQMIANANSRKTVRQAIVSTQAEIKQAKASSNQDDVSKLENRLQKLKQELNDLRAEALKVEEPVAVESQAASAAPAGSTAQLDGKWDPVIREAYLRTLSREPTAAELHRTKQYISESDKPNLGLRDVVWALLNTKEFIVNH